MSQEYPYNDRPWTRYYDEGAPAGVKVSPGALWTLLDGAAESFPRRAALRFYGAALCYAELKEKADAFAAALGELGVKKGDRVALYLLNSPQFVIAYFGAVKAGAVVVPVSPAYSSSELAFQLKDSGSSYVVCQDVLYDNVERAAVDLSGVIVTGAHEYLPTLKGVFAKKVSIPNKSGVYSFQKLLRRSVDSFSPVEVDPREDLAVLPYTGGTAAQPKGVRLTHANLVSCARQLRAFFPTLVEGEEAIAASLPLYHIYGQVAALLVGVELGATMVLFTSLDLGHILPAIEREKVTVFYGVPALYDVLKDHSKTTLVDWNRMKLIVSGADALPETIATAWEARTGRAIMEGFGMTETSGVSHVSPPQRIKRGSFGVPIPNVHAAVADVEEGELLPVGEIGELVLAGPNITSGYWQRDEENGRSFTEMDGRFWFRTGDLVRIDEEGYFYYCARTKDLIKHKGFSVFLREIEELLGQHPMVKAAGVVGAKDPKDREYPMAYVVLRPEARGRVTEAEIRDFLKGRLASYKVPRVVEFRSELPKTDVGKVSRRELREESEGL
ncbi:MAG: AMP-binding protein [Candidatus Bipolaricaulota bacterium]